MEKFFHKINSQEKVEYESQIALWIYNVIIGNKIQYEDLIITEDMINAFNISTANERLRIQVIEFVNKNNELINKMIINFYDKPWEYVKPVIWSNNLKNSYLIKNLTLSHRFEVYVDYLFKNNGIDIGLYYGREEQHRGECRLGIEIKRDIKSKETGNLYIEYAERHFVEGEWVPSGIFKKDNTRYFLIGDIDGFWILEKDKLNQLFLKIKNNNGRPYNRCRLVGAERGTSLGFIIPKEMASKMVIDINRLVQIFLDEQ